MILLRLAFTMLNLALRVYAGISSGRDFLFTPNTCLPSCTTSESTRKTSSRPFSRRLPGPGEFRAGTDHRARNPAQSCIFPMVPGGVSESRLSCHQRSCPARPSACGWLGQGTVQLDAIRHPSKPEPGGNVVVQSCGKNIRATSLRHKIEMVYEYFI